MALIVKNRLEADLRTLRLPLKVAYSKTGIFYYVSIRDMLVKVQALNYANHPGLILRTADWS